MEILRTKNNKDSSNGLKMIDFLEEFAGDKIGFDIDGTIDDTAGPAIRNYHSEFGQRSKLRYAHHLEHYYSMTDWLMNDHGMGPDVAMINAVRIWNDHTTVMLSKPEQGAVALIKFITSRKTPIIPHFITSRPAQNAEITLRWMAKHLPMIPADHIHIQDSPTYDNKYKARTVKELGLKVYFEDSIEHAQEISEIVVPGFGHVNVGFIRQPWNANFNPAPGSSIIVPSNRYSGRPNIIQAFLSVFDNWKQTY